MRELKTDTTARIRPPPSAVRPPHDPLHGPEIAVLSRGEGNLALRHAFPPFWTSASDRMSVPAVLPTQFEGAEPVQANRCPPSHPFPLFSALPSPFPSNSSDTPTAKPLHDAPKLPLYSAPGGSYVALPLASLPRTDSLLSSSPAPHGRSALPAPLPAPQPALPAPGNTPTGGAPSAISLQPIEPKRLAPRSSFQNELETNSPLHRQNSLKTKPLPRPDRRHRPPGSFPPETAFVPPSSAPSRSPALPPPHVPRPRTQTARATPRHPVQLTLPPGTVPAPAAPFSPVSSPPAPSALPRSPPRSAPPSLPAPVRIHPRSAAS